MAYTSVIHGVGSSTNRFKLSKANRNYTTQYFVATHASGDIRARYLHQRFTSTGGGEVIRAVGEAYGTGVATGGTVNAGHFTGRIGTAGTVSGALNAIRATIETADSITPGGTTGALQLDSNIGSGATVSNMALLRFTKSGTTDVPFLMAIDDDQACKGSTATSADGLKIRWHDGTTKYVMIGS